MSCWKKDTPQDNHQCVCLPCLEMFPVCVCTYRHILLLFNKLYFQVAAFFKSGMFPNQLNDATFAPCSRDFPRTRLNPDWTYTELAPLF